MGCGFTRWLGRAGVGCGGVTPDERWLAAVWLFVRAWLPAPPATVVEIGCGPLGGFVPVLRSAGYDATGVDPQAPQEPWYQRAEFEQCEMPGPACAVVACTSLHHVADLGEVLNLAVASLVAGGTLVVVEWARERFDEATARWCFDRLPQPTGDPGWLSDAMTSGRPRASPGMITAGPGPKRRACTPGRTSSASLTPGLTRNCSLTGPISFPTWPVSAKTMSRRRSTPGRSRPTASPTWASGGKGTVQVRNTAASDTPRSSGQRSRRSQQPQVPRLRWRHA